MKYWLRKIEKKVKYLACFNNEENYSGSKGNPITNCYQMTLTFKPDEIMDELQLSQEGKAF